MSRAIGRIPDLSGRRFGATPMKSNRASIASVKGRSREKVTFSLSTRDKNGSISEPAQGAFPIIVGRFEEVFYIVFLKPLDVLKCDRVKKFRQS